MFQRLAWFTRHHITSNSVKGCLTSMSVSGAGCAVKLIVPLHRRYIFRSGIVPMRLRDSQCIESALSFVEPLQIYTSRKFSTSNSTDLITRFSSATVGILLFHDSRRNSDAGYEALSRAVESDLKNRLPFPWIRLGTPQCKAYVLVDTISSRADRELVSRLQRLEGGHKACSLVILKLLVVSIGMAPSNKLSSFGNDRVTHC